MTEAEKKAAKAKTEAEKKAAEDFKKSGMIVAEGGIYYAQTKCYWGIALYPVNKPIRTKKGQHIPHHFAKKKVLPPEVLTEEEELMKN